MTDAPHVVVRTYSDVSPQEARDARVLALRFALDCYAKKNSAGVPNINGNDATKGVRISEKEEEGRHVEH
jgi:hypothetical protein